MVLEQRWVELAERSCDQIEAQPFGKRGGKTKDLAEVLEVSPAYLRRAISAHKFAATDPFPKVVVSTLPLPVVEELRTWREFNRGRATAAARLFARGKMTVEKLIERSRAARAGRTKPSLAHRTTRPFRMAVRDHILREMPQFEELERFSELTGAHITLQSRDGLQRLAIVATGPFSDIDIELAKCRDALLTALGLLFSHDIVSLACSSKEAERHARAMLKSMPLAREMEALGRPLEKRLSIWAYDAKKHGGPFDQRSAAEQARSMLGRKAPAARAKSAHGSANRSPQPDGACQAKATERSARKRAG
ncbi:hypothetical protein [Chenggangzhangella methanolivorans]|uniref:Uncharacterized protein n=1 Tax=Chenggangzhangella methanolivorans TaxID=1437009 RepID=A0A9E6ULL2_9HYPH|nr:hypothetical protein [Chenggangzhangella methanolivorans]QZN99085.1 hypothetical protein K6K41_19865 [Chenggangzhangella methanolivorans]